MLKSGPEARSNIWWIRLAAVAFLLIGLAVGYFTYSSEVAPTSRFPFKLGLDLAGGVHLVYRADITQLAAEEVDEALEALRVVIERRVNSRDLAGVTGVLDPSVQISKSSALAETEEYRLIVELPGVTDVEQAKAIIGVTPLLEFKLVDNAFLPQVPLVTAGEIEAIPPEGYIDTGLTGRFLEQAKLEFAQSQGGPLLSQPMVVLTFNTEGAERFATITGEHVGEVLAIFLDGRPIQLPFIQEAIPNGTAVITGSYTPEEAREVVRNLNLGALPVPIESVSTQTIGPSLGSETLTKGVWAGLWGLGAVALFMIAWYRLPGLIAVVALTIYVVLNVAVFKLVPVTLTAAGIAGFILSIGMAVDANILIFSRLKEELDAGKSLRDAVRDGFSRAWLSIRDGNFTSIISSIIIFYAGTFLTRGFAITLTIGIVISMFTALTITRTLLLALGDSMSMKTVRFLYGHGIRF